MLYLTTGGFEPLVAMVHTGLGALGLELDERRAERHGWRPRRDHRGGARPRERAAAAAELAKQRQRLSASHAARPYRLVVVQLSADSSHDGANGFHAELVDGLVPRGAERPRVACLCTDARPPPVWQMWVPPFCDRVFVREMRLR